LKDKRKIQLSQLSHDLSVLALEEAIDQEQAPENSSKIKQHQIHLKTGALTDRNEAARLGVRNKTGHLDSKAQRAHEETRRRELQLLTVRRPAVVTDCV
jgi:hypothetical protein